MSSTCRTGSRLNENKAFHRSQNECPAQRTAGHDARVRRRTAWYELVGYVSARLPKDEEPHGPPLQHSASQSNTTTLVVVHNHHAQHLSSQQPLACSRTKYCGRQRLRSAAIAMPCRQRKTRCQRLLRLANKTGFGLKTNWILRAPVHDVTVNVCRK
jgi:hypothetical protein